MTPGLALGYTAQTVEVPVGGKLKDYGIAHDMVLGKLLVRLYVGSKKARLHDPSPPLARRDVWALRLCVRGHAAVPDRLDGWWATLPEASRAGLVELLVALPLVAWLVYWLSAGDGTDPEDGLDEQPEDSSDASGPPQR